MYCPYTCNPYIGGLLMVILFILFSFIFSAIFWKTKKWMDCVEAKCMKKRQAKNEGK